MGIFGLWSSGHSLLTNFMPFKIGRGLCVLSLSLIEREHFADATQLSATATPMKLFTKPSEQIRRSYGRDPVSFQFP